MAVAAPRRLRSGSLSSEEASYSEDEENGGRLRSFVSQAPTVAIERKQSLSPEQEGRSPSSSDDSPPRRKKPRYGDTPPRKREHRSRQKRSPSPRSSGEEDGRGGDPKGRKSEEEDEPVPKRKKEDIDPILTRTGGAYIPPARLRMMQQSITDKNSMAYQRLAWEALKKSINGLINKVNVANIGNIVSELFQENVVRGRGLLARSVIQAQAASPMFTHVYAALVAVINTKFPQTGELIAKRLVSQFRKGYRRNDKNTCVTAVKFLAHLVNQQVLHELVALEVLTLLLEDPTDDSVEVAVGFLKEVGLKLIEVSPRGVHAVFETLRSVLHSGKITPRVQYMIEVMFAIRKDQFKDHPSVLEELDLVQEDDQITHLLSLDDEFDTEETLNVFHHDPDFMTNEDKYKLIKEEILGEGSDSEEGSGSSGDESSEEESEEEEGMEEGEKAGMDITDKTDSKVLGVRRTIYLTIMSSLDFEECAHKLIKNMVEGMEGEVAYMLIECCSQERSYLRFYGLLGQRLCLLNQIWVEKFDEAFQQQYSTVHRLETNKLRNVAKFFGQLFYADALPWTCMSCIHLNEEETNSSSRIFVKILMQELAEFMGLTKLNERLRDPLLASAFEGLLPRDNPKNTRFAINFFTSIGLGGLTDDLREHLKNAQKLIMAQRQEVSSSDSDSSSEEEEDSSDDDNDSSSSGEESSSSGSSEAESNESSEDERKRRRQKKKRERSSRERSRDKEHKKRHSHGSSRKEKADRRDERDPRRKKDRSQRRDRDEEEEDIRGRERHEQREQEKYVEQERDRRDRRRQEDSPRRDRGREKDMTVEIDVTRERDRDTGRDRDRGSERDRGRERERGRDRDRDRDERRRDRDGDKEERRRDRDEGRGGRRRDGEKSGRDREQEREKGRGRERDRDRRRTEKEERR